MKNLKNLKGAKSLSKQQQQSVKGGAACHDTFYPCPRGYFCSPHGKCRMIH